MFFFFLMIRLPPRSTRTDTLFPYTTLVRSADLARIHIFVAQRRKAIFGKIRAMAACQRCELNNLDGRVGIAHDDAASSVERRVGKECVSTGSSRWSTYHSKQKTSSEEPSTT